LNREVVDRKIQQLRIPEVGKATIREIVALVNLVEEETGVKYIRWKWAFPDCHPQKLAWKPK
jgi:hypothetical protein